MPRCYLLLACAGSSVDQQSNNFSLFNLVEQINVPVNAPRPPQGAIPLEVHAYWQLTPTETGGDYEARFVLVADTGLETLSDVFRFRSATPRFRTRSLGMPLPPVMGTYELRVDWRGATTESWTRDPAAWPITVVEARSPAAVTH